MKYTKNNAKIGDLLMIETGKDQVEGAVFGVLKEIGIEIHENNPTAYYYISYTDDRSVKISENEIFNMKIFNCEMFSDRFQNIMENHNVTYKNDYSERDIVNIVLEKWSCFSEGEKTDLLELLYNQEYLVYVLNAILNEKIIN